MIGNDAISPKILKLTVIALAELVTVIALAEPILSQTAKFFISKRCFPPSDLKSSPFIEVNKIMTLEIISPFPFFSHSPKY
jgi:hypothetical protein